MLKDNLHGLEKMKIGVWIDMQDEIEKNIEKILKTYYT